MNDTPTVKLQFEGNLGYSADQVSTRTTLGDLLEQLQDAVERFGEDATLVLFQTNNRYGANFGKLATFESMFSGDSLLHCSHCGEHLSVNVDEEDWVECPECGFDLDVATLEPVVA